MAGPWFMVSETGSDFRHLGDIWLSDGERDEGLARLEMKVELLPALPGGALALHGETASPKPDELEGR